jgi:uncharacterized protein (TIGR02246 family)
MTFGHNFFGNQPFRMEEAHNNVSVAVQNWLNTLCTHNVDAIVSLYAPDGILLGTVAKEIAQGQAEIRKYFEMFVQKKPCGKITSMIVQNFGNVKVVDGTYTFELHDGKKKSIVHARYTFVFQYRQGRWVIATHHSSKQP